MILQSLKRNRNRKRQALRYIAAINADGDALSRREKNLIIRLAVVGEGGFYTVRSAKGIPILPTRPPIG